MNESIIIKYNIEDNSFGLKGFWLEHVYIIKGIELEINEGYTVYDMTKGGELNNKIYLIDFYQFNNITIHKRISTNTIIKALKSKMEIGFEGKGLRVIVYTEKTPTDNILSNFFCDLTDYVEDNIKEIIRDIIETGKNG